jgi:hypothetical protein
MPRYQLGKTRIRTFRMLRSVKYENKIVAFYDILGWRNKIHEAGNSPRRIAELRNIVDFFHQMKHEYETKNRRLKMKVSTFSDNVVISATVSKQNLFVMLVILAQAQMLAAWRGIFIRGAVTIGKIVHDDFVVFGPGLNRAYELESNVARYPRVLVDHVCLKVFGSITLDPFVVSERDISFLNPWSIDFVEFVFRDFKKPGARRRLTLIFFEVAKAWEAAPDRKIRRRLQWLTKRVLGGLEAPTGIVQLEDDHLFREIHRMDTNPTYPVPSAGLIESRSTRRRKGTIQVSMAS